MARTYHISRLFDSAGTRLAEVTAAGLVRYKDGWWVDSTAGNYASLDVSGPDTERFLFAVRQGQLLARSWSMSLTGRGTIPADRGRIDTTAAGLFASETEEIIPADRARLLMRP